jgi:hypothetical protein
MERATNARPAPSAWEMKAISATDAHLFTLIKRNQRSKRSVDLIKRSTEKINGCSFGYTRSASPALVQGLLTTK